jgi:hypothetical protein
MAYEFVGVTISVTTDRQILNTQTETDAVAVATGTTDGDFLFLVVSATEGPSGGNSIVLSGTGWTALTKQAEQNTPTPDLAAVWAWWKFQEAGAPTSYDVTYTAGTGSASGYVGPQAALLTYRGFTTYGASSVDGGFDSPGAYTGAAATATVAAQTNTLGAASLLLIRYGYALLDNQANNTLAFTTTGITPRVDQRSTVPGAGHHWIWVGDQEWTSATDFPAADFTTDPVGTHFTLMLEYALATPTAAQTPSAPPTAAAGVTVPETKLRLKQLPNKVSAASLDGFLDE